MSRRAWSMRRGVDWMRTLRRVVVGHRHKYDKLGSYDPVRRYMLGEGLVVSTGELWRRQRKLMAPFFTPKGVQAYAALMLRDGAVLVDRWPALAGAGTEVEVAREMALVTASIILTTRLRCTLPVFGRQHLAEVGHRTKRSLESRDDRRRAPETEGRQGSREPHLHRRGGHRVGVGDHCPPGRARGDEVGGDAVVSVDGDRQDGDIVVVAAAHACRRSEDPPIPAD